MDYLEDVTIHIFISKLLFDFHQIIQNKFLEGPYNLLKECEFSFLPLNLTRLDSQGRYLWKIQFRQRGIQNFRKYKHNMTHQN